MAKNEEHEMIPDRDEYELFYNIPLPFTSGNITFAPNPHMPNDIFYAPFHPDHMFDRPKGESFRRAGNVVATDKKYSFEFSASWEGTLYISNKGAYMLVQNQGCVSMSGSQNSINMNLFPPPQPSRFEGVYPSGLDTLSLPPRKKSRFEDIYDIDL